MLKEHRIAIVSHIHPLYLPRVLQGISAYMQHHPGWRYVLIDGEGLGDPQNAGHGDLRPCDGIITILTSHEATKIYRKLKKPLVQIHRKLPLEEAPSVEVNDLQVGRLAVAHFVECGLKSLAYYGFQDFSSKQRLAGFIEAVQNQKDKALQLKVNAPDIFYRRMFLTKRIVNWIRKLPKPVGILAFNDQLAGRIMGVCQRFGISVPGEVAVLGVDNLSTLEQFAVVSLSTIDPNVPRLGYEAAALLDRLLAGNPPPSKPILVEPLGVVARESTNITASSDPQLAEVLRQIHAQACEGGSVDEILKKTVASRRTIELHFRKTLGRTPAQEIRRVRLEQVRQLLADSQMSLVEIAVRTGFEHASHMCSAFRKAFGQTPTEYRHKYATGRYASSCDDADAGRKSADGF